MMPENGSPAVATLKPRDPVRYRSLGVGYYDAQVVAVRPDGSVDLNVYMPGVAEPVALSRIVVASWDGWGRGECRAVAYSSAPAGPGL